jgi:hypothetical protein
MRHRLTASRVRGFFRGDKDAVGRRNPFVVFRLGKHHAQTKALRVRSLSVALFRENLQALL